MKNNKIIPEYEEIEVRNKKRKSSIDIDNEKSLKQFKYTIEEIEIFFPYKAYHSQIDYMRESKI